MWHSPLYLRLSRDSPGALGNAWPLQGIHSAHSKMKIYEVIIGFFFSLILLQEH